ncbi:tRNA wybutosine-synthesizing protein 2/3/4-like isoform X2 [Hibiscus syriacus]|uniref:tRNA wybutosine-synthesizing protein 2/3/4-like isoform X2 n=1 Tax=Hibiscus syriacus TaxID=106335 RepID=A0A6A2ZYW9_HIBSY|nr:tRNA wybutosine-synthesizing protein 2/3/4-like isoform X2 [Hibiscus syriacus]
MESMGWKIIGGADDFEIEAETRKQPKGGYMYFYMAECKRIKEDGTQSGSVTKDVRSKWNSMSDAEKEPYITQSRNDSKEYKERRKAHENKTNLNGRVTIILSKHLKLKVLLNEMSSSAALDILKEFGAIKLPDEVVQRRKASKSPLKIMTEADASLIRQNGLSDELLEQLPNRWERLGDIIVFPISSFRDPGRVAANGTRDSTLEILVGDSGWVDHRENGILYSFDAIKCMFSWGNLSEKIRMANLDSTDAVIVDLFAGIGYFVFPFLIRFDKGVPDRVCLGLIPSSEGSWLTAVRALRTGPVSEPVMLPVHWFNRSNRSNRSEGGILHVHGNAKDAEEELWANHVSKSISEFARCEGRCWGVIIDHAERVKWYAPHIRHLVADVRCRQI